VFKWSSLDPDIKCSEVVASINIKKVTPEIITKITELLRDTIPCLCLDWIGVEEGQRKVTKHGVNDKLRYLKMWLRSSGFVMKIGGLMFKSLICF